MPTETAPVLEAPNRDLVKNHMQAKWSLPTPTIDDPPAPAPAAKPVVEAPKPSAEPTPEPPKPAAAAVVEPPKPADEPKWPRNAKEWDSYKAAEKQRTADAQKAADQYRLDLEATKKEIEALRKSGPSPELDTLKQERDDLLNRIRTIDVEKDPRFQRYFTSKTNSQLELAKSIVGADHAETVSKLLSLPEGEFRDSKIEEFMGNLTPMQHTRLGGVLNSLAQISQERTAALDEARTNYDSIQAKTKAEQESAMNQYKATATQTFDATLSEARKESPFFQTKEGDDAHNTEVTERIAIAKELMFDKKPLDQVAQAAMYAAAFPASLREIQSQKAEIEKLTAQVASLTAASPSLGTTKPTETGGNPVARPKVQPGMSPMAAAAEWTKLGNNQ